MNRTKHAIVPRFGEGRQSNVCGLRWSLKGKLVAQLSLAHLSRLVGSENSGASLFPAPQRHFTITSHESEEVNQVILFHLL